MHALCNTYAQKSDTSDFLTGITPFNVFTFYLFNNILHFTPNVFCTFLWKFKLHFKSDLKWKHPQYEELFQLNKITTWNKHGTKLCLTSDVIQIWGDTLFQTPVTTTLSLSAMYAVWLSSVSQQPRDDPIIVVNWIMLQSPSYFYPFSSRLFCSIFSGKLSVYVWGPWLDIFKTRCKIWTSGTLGTSGDHERQCHWFLGFLFRFLIRITHPMWVRFAF